MRKRSKLFLFPLALSVILSGVAIGGGIQRGLVGNQTILKAEDSTNEKTATLTFTEACKGKGVDDKDASWEITSDAEESVFEDNRGIHYGTSSAKVSFLKATTSAYMDKAITKIVVNASAANKGSPKLNVMVGDSVFGNEQTLATDNKPYTFEGSASGKIIINIHKNKTQKALYLKSIEVTYTDIEIQNPAKIIYDLNYDGQGDKAEQIVEKGKKFTKPSDPTRPSDDTYSYSFAGWYTDPEYTKEFDFNSTAEEGETTVYAKWNKTSVTIHNFENSEVKSNIRFDYDTKNLVQIPSIEYDITSDKNGNNIKEGDEISTPTEKAEGISIKLTTKNNNDDYKTGFWKNGNNLRLYNGDKITIQIDEEYDLPSKIQFNLTENINNSPFKIDDINDKIEYKYNNGKIQNILIIPPSKIFTLSIISTVKISSIDFDYKLYSNFENMQLQFQNEFAYTDEKITETGLYISDYKSENPNEDFKNLPSTFEKDGASYKCIKADNANFKSKYTVGINLDESQYNLELTGYGYIKYDGVYHFNKSKTFSINSIVEYYSTNDTQLSDKEKAVILALKNSLNK